MEQPTPPSEFDPAAATAAADPGWYPVDQGHQRYWDGSTWTEHTAPLAMAGTPGVAGQGAVSSDDKTFALLMHLLGGFVTFLVPLIMWLMKKDESAFINHHGKEAINFHITMWIAFIVSFVSVFILIGFLLFPAVLIWYFVATILATLAASRGEWYRYPLIIRFIK